MSMDHEVESKVFSANFRAALASFVQEHLPVADAYSDQMTDVAWAIADRLELRFLDAFQRVREGTKR